MQAIRTVHLSTLAETIAHHIQNASHVSIITGAGASRAAGIPGAAKMAEMICEEFGHCTNRLSKPNQADYGKVMACLSPSDREKFIQPLLEKAGVNWGQIALASLLKSRHVSRVLTFNFDLILERALSLLGTHLPVYDFGTAPTQNINRIAMPAIIHLHGQSHGMVLLNSDDETKDHTDKISPLLTDTVRNHVTIICGYSGLSDAAFEVIEQEYSNHNYLFWLGYSKEPAPHLSTLLENEYASYHGNCDFDITMMDIAKALNAWPPEIFNNPMQHLLDELKDVTKFPFGKINEEEKQQDLLISTRDRLEGFAKNWEENRSPDEKVLGKLIADTPSSDETNTHVKLSELSDDTITALSWSYISEATALKNQALKLWGKEQKEKIEQAAKYFQKAIDIKPNMHQAYFNWGVALTDLAETLSGNEQQKTLKQAIFKYQKAIDIKPDKHGAYNNWGAALSAIAKNLNGEEQQQTFIQAIAKYQIAIDIKTDQHDACINWGIALTNLAETLSGEEQQKTFEQACKKYQKVVDTGTDKYEVYRNWGATLIRMSKTQSGKEQQKTLEQACVKYQKAIDIKPDFHEAYSNWAVGLLHLAANLSGKEQQKAYELAEKKALQAQKITQKADYNLACVYAQAKRHDEAIKQLNTCLADGTLVSLEHLETDTDMDPLRDRADFKALLKKLK